MASKTSAGTGTVVTIVILGVLWLATFVAAIVFYGQRTSAMQARDEAQSAVEEFIRGNERGRQEVVLIKDRANAARQSVVGYLVAAQSEMMDFVTGNSRDDVTSAKQKLADMGVNTSASLSDTIKNLQNQIDQLTRERDQALAAREAAESDLKGERDKLARIQDEFEQNLRENTSSISAYRDDVEDYRQGANEARTRMEQTIDMVRNEAAQRESALQGQVQRLQNENLRLQDTIASYQQERSKDRLKPKDEFALVDGRVIGVDPAENTVFINRGQRDKIVLGMSFSVYEDASTIKPDPTTGEYPRGKAAVEVISVNETSSTGRILYETQGNPIGRGDVIANPVYDPDKVYTFLVYGNFDINGDGRSTPAEQTDVAALIESWGGTTVDELTGAVDFLVLGERPVLPPRPGLDTPAEVLIEYRRLERAVRRYDELFETAGATSIPVLNQNRLFTLMGR